MRLIDADALLNRDVYYDRMECLVLRYEIEKAPTIDAVPVVRCKDCKDYEYGECVCQHKVMSDGAHYYPDEDDFCNYGERRSDG